MSFGYKIDLMIKHYVATVGIIVFIFFAACTKESNKKYCWRLYDMSRNALDDEVCGKTRAQMEAIYGDACFEHADEKATCWKIERTDEVVSATEAFIDFFYVRRGLAVSKHECVPCENWKLREKIVYKPDSTFFFSEVTAKRFCGDTLNTLFQGRNIIIRESADSVVFLQFSKDGYVWE